MSSNLTLHDDSWTQIWDAPSAELEGTSHGRMSLSIQDLPVNSQTTQEWDELGLTLTSNQTNTHARRVYTFTNGAISPSPK